MSLEFNQTTAGLVPFSRGPCFLERIIGSVYLILFLSSVILNPTVIWAIVKHKTLHTPINYLNIFLAVIGLLGTVTELPLVAANGLSCSFIFNNSVCLYMGFSLLWIATLNAYTLMTISIERYLVICKPFKTKLMSTKRCILFIIAIMIIGFLLPTLPLFGWSEYTLDYAHITCFVNEDITRIDVLAYYLMAFVVIYVIPLSILVYTNLVSVSTVRKSSKKFENDRIAEKTFKKESHLMKIAIITILAQTLSYAPFLIIALLRFIVGNKVPVSAYLISAMISRFPLIWPSTINMVMNKDIKPYIFKNNKVTNFNDSTR